MSVSLALTLCVLLLPAQADEALTDPNATVYDPDYAKPEWSRHPHHRLVAVGGTLLVVITLWDKGVLYGSNCWFANEKDQRLYHEEKDEG